MESLGDEASLAGPQLRETILYLRVGVVEGRVLEGFSLLTHEFEQKKAEVEAVIIVVPWRNFLRTTWSVGRRIKC